LALPLQTLGQHTEIIHGNHPGDSVSKEETMRYLKLSALLACGAALVVGAGCSDAMAPPLEPDPIELDLQVQRDGGSGEVCYYVGSARPDENRHVVSWQGDFLDEHGFRFREPLPDPGFFPDDPPLVAHVIRLYKDGSFETEDRVGTGYVVSVVEKEGRNKYNMFHQIVIQPWMGPEKDGDPNYRDYGYNAGLCDADDQKLVHVCTDYDLDGNCTAYVERPACVGSVLGTSSMTCNRLPCDTRSPSVSFDFDSWQGLQVVSGGLNHGSDGELRQGTGDFSDFALLYGWHHGSFCVTYDGGVDLDPEPDPEPDPDPDLVASFTYSCGNTDECTFTDTSTGGATTWDWLFQNGDPGLYDEQGPVTVTYSSAGKHAVTLVVENADGFSATATGEVSCTSHRRFGIRCN